MNIDLRTLLVLAFSVASLGLAACNTTAGVGKDIEATGDAIEDTADDTKTEMQN
jgi:predicted small secreted protein